MDRSCARASRFRQFRFAIAAAVVAVLGTYASAPGVARADDRTQIAITNRRLVTIARSALPGARTCMCATETAQVWSNPDLSFAPSSFPIRIPVALLRIGGYERALHLHTNTVNANFWGVFNGGRGTFVKLTFHF